MKTPVIDATPVDMSFIVEMMYARIERIATPDDTIVEFNDHLLELSDVTYCVDCSVVVSYADIDHRGDGWDCEPQPDIIDNYGIYGLRVLKCLPDEQYRLNINPDNLQDALRGPRLWYSA